MLRIALESKVGKHLFGEFLIIHKNSEEQQYLKTMRYYDTKTRQK
jgi:hypothetical protein